MNLCDRSAIEALLRRHGFRFSKSLGQNFLIEDWVPRQIAEACGADASCGVLEIGPGIGPLTYELCRRAGRVAAVELDTALLPILSETMAGCENFKLVPGDILQLNIPALAAEELGGLRPLVCANLPYHITTPILTALVEAGCFESITVMIQKEVAERIAAAPGPEYGAFSVFMQYYTVRAAFSQRRKTLINSLSSAFGDRLGKGELREAVISCGLPETVRGERLGLEAFAALSDALADRIPGEREGAEKFLKKS